MDAAYAKIQQILDRTPDDALAAAIVNVPFVYKLETVKLCLGIIVLLLADGKTGLIYRVSLSDTELAVGTKRMSVKKFEDITIPMGYADNVIAQAIATGKPQSTTDWKYLFTPTLTPKEARFNQAGGAIACSTVYPLPGVGDGAALIFSYYQYAHKLGKTQQDFMERYTALVAKRLAAAKTPLRTRLL